MKRPIIILVFIILSVASVSGNPAASQPRNLARIISLKPNITEILFALGAGDRVAGVTTWCDRPEEAKKLPKVADYISLNTERIIALSPDLVIGSEENSIKSQFGVLSNAGIATMTLPFKTLAELYSSIEKIAGAVGKKEAGKKLVENIKQAGRPAGRQRTVLVLVGHRPFIAAGPKSFIGEIVAAAGGKNVVESTLPYPSINGEFILASAPELVIDLTMGSEEDKRIPHIEGSDLVKFDMSDFRAGPNVGLAVKKLSEALEKR